MAPFYSRLSIWIGGIVLVAMLKVKVSEKSDDRFKECEASPDLLWDGSDYFMIVGLFQSSLIAQGSVLSWYSVQTSVFVSAGRAGSQVSCL